MNWQRLLAAAFAQMRSTRRQVRTWLFVVVAVGFSLTAFMGLSVQHATQSAHSPSFVFASRFLVSTAGIPLLGILLVGIVFLTFDGRSQDRRERMVDVLDARPIGNIELLGGRLLGIVVVAWLPVVVFAGIAQSAATLGEFVGLPVSPIEPLSLAAYVLLTTLPYFVFWTAVVLTLATGLRNRLATAVAALALFAVWFWALGNMPLYLVKATAGLTLASDSSSDLLPRLADAPTLVHRLAMVVLAAGLVVLSAVVHSRPDGGRRGRRLAVAAALFAAGGAGIALCVHQASADVAERQQWREIHEAAARFGRADILHVRGVVRIAPDRQAPLALDVVMGVRPTPDGRPLTFSFNPDMVIDDLKVGPIGATLQPADFRHEHGLLTVDLPASLHGDVELAVRARGGLDGNFAYLDSASDVWTDETGVDNSAGYLGIEAAILDRRYVALMPGVHWLPNAGANFGIDDVRLAPRDYFALDLAVEVPDGWLVAGPGRRRSVATSAGGSRRFRFAPDAPTPAFGLIASSFERRALQISGVEYELLVNPGHLRNVDLFGDAAPALAERLGALLEGAARAGLPYPYDGFSLVEMPGALRTYGGGWRLDTVMALPGIMLMSERGFPTARFDAVFAELQHLDDHVDGVAEAKADVLARYFERDHLGGNPFVGGSRNFMGFQTGATGKGAVALEFVVSELANLVLSRRSGYFSAHAFMGRNGGVQNFGLLMLSAAADESGSSRTPLDLVANRPTVWGRMLGQSLVDLDPTEDPALALDVLAFKCRAVARSIHDGLGREKTAALLAELRRRHVGGHYDVGDFHAAAAAVGAELGAVVGDWLHDDALPGFLASAATTVRLADDDNGRPRYQTRLHIRNDERVPGTLRLAYATISARERDVGMRYGEPLRVGGKASVEVGVVTAAPIAELWIEPYLALNRRAVRISLNEGTTSSARSRGSEEAALVGIRHSDWLPRRDVGIIVDDLDAGFSVEAGPERDRILRFRGARQGEFEGEVDAGLPAFAPGVLLNAHAWLRAEIPSSWGKYRHTTALGLPGAKDARAVFRTDLPTAGRWIVQYHMPPLPREGAAFGVAGILSSAHREYDMHLEDAAGAVHAIEFDAAIAEVGWNTLGTFELPAGAVRIVVGNRTEGDVVLADAVRWQRATH